MKLSIEVEVSPEEVPLALELFQTLRALTDNVKFNYPSGAPMALPAAGAQSLNAAAPGGAQPGGPPLPPLQPDATPFVPSRGGAALAQPAASIKPTPEPVVGSEVRPASARPQSDEAANAGGGAGKAVAAAPSPASSATTPAAAAPVQQQASVSPPSAETQANANFKFFKTQIEALQHAEQQPQYGDLVVESINGYLKQLEGSPQLDEVIQYLLDAFVQVVFYQEVPSVAPFMSLIPRLDPAARTKVRDSLIQMVLKHLVIKRDVSTDRSEFFAHAEVFASLVSLEFVKVSGAVSTIIALLKKKENRCAAITMLGKTVEVCHQQLLTRCGKDSLAMLRDAVACCTEDDLKYDVAYISEVMDWGIPVHSQPTAESGPSSVPPAGGSQVPPSPVTGETAGGALPAGARDADNGMASSAGGAPPPEYVGLRPLKCFEGGHHRDVIVGMFVDDKCESIVSASKDGALVSWSLEGGAPRWAAGKELGSQHVLCALDGQPGRCVLAACVPREGIDAVSTVVLYKPVAAGGGAYKEAGRMSQAGTSLISCVRACPLEGQTTFVTGETVDVAADSKGGGGGQKFEEQVRLYDMAGLAMGQLFHSLRPVRVYSEHRDLVTCVCMSRRDPCVFLSGSRDATVRMWDSRVERCVAVLGVPRGGGGGGQGQGGGSSHAGMITSVDSSEYGILSSSVDKHVKLWDARVLSNQGGSTQPVLDTLIDSPVLNVAFAPGASPLGQRAALATMRGLLVANFGAMGSDAKATLVKADLIPEHKPNYRYVNVKWSYATGVMYGACDDFHIDAYSPVV